jgi:hypothetical protein
MTEPVSDYAIARARELATKSVRSDYGVQRFWAIVFTSGFLAFLGAVVAGSFHRAGVVGSLVVGGFIAFLVFGTSLGMFEARRASAALKLSPQQLGLVTEKQGLLGGSRRVELYDGKSIVGTTILRRPGLLTSLPDREEVLVFGDPTSGRPVVCVLLGADLISTISFKRSSRRFTRGR